LKKATDIKYAFKNEILSTGLKQLSRVVLGVFCGYRYGYSRDCFSYKIA